MGKSANGKFKDTENASILAGLDGESKLINLVISSGEDLNFVLPKSSLMPVLSIAMPKIVSKAANLFAALLE